MRYSCAIALPLCVLFLSGCSVAPVLTSTSTDSVLGTALSGKVHGGQSPITGAHVYLLAANTTGYGAASVSLLTSGTGRTLDSSGGPTNGFYYVTSDSNGNFTISGDYTCTANTQVYVYALGGNPGGGANAVAGLMAALGNCPSAGNFETAAPFLFVNEVSTVAMAYATAGFATDALHVSSSGTVAAEAGIANAFLNVEVLETLSTGVANAAPPGLPTGTGPGAVPQAEINTLGNILAACVNSAVAPTGPTNPSPCYTLFTNAMSGGTTGTQPADTATAAINIAHNPVAAVGALYGLSSAYAQFNPTLTAQPSNFTMSIYFNNGFLSYGGPVAIDASDNVWIAANSVFKWNGQAYDFTGGNGYSGFLGYNLAIDVNGNAWVLDSNAVGEFNNSGTLLSPSGGYTTGLSLSSPTYIAMDSSSNAWIEDSTTGKVVKVSSSGTLSGAFTGSGLTAPGPVAIDASGDAWIADTTSGAIVELSPTGSPLSGGSGYTSVGLNTPTGIAIDHNGNVWVSNSGLPNGSVTEISKTGTLLSGSSGFTNSALSNPLAIAIDGAGNAWVAGESTTSEISPTGTFLSGSTGFPAADGPNGFTEGFGIAIDGSGDVWLNYDPGSFLFGYSYYMQEMVGAATPVVTPLSVGVKNNTLGTRP